MSRLEIAIERLRALPLDEQDAIADEIDAILAEPASKLTQPQWGEIDGELAASADGAELTHAQVVHHMRKRFGR